MNRSIDGRSQTGIGLVELIVAMAAGLFLVGGLTQIFLNQRESFRAQEAQSKLQESARLVSVLLSSSISKAGFRRDPEDDPAFTFAGALVITGTDDESAGTPVLDGTDTITFRFQGDGLMTDCLGGLVAAGDISINIYRVNDSRALQCRARDAASPNATFQPLLDNVENMQILYGEDTNGDGSVDRYVNAGAVGNFDDVLNVHVAVLLASEIKIKTAPTAGIYDLLGSEVKTPADRIQRRVVERVISLRNRLL